MFHRRSPIQYSVDCCIPRDYTWQPWCRRHEQILRILRLLSYKCPSFPIMRSPQHLLAGYGGAFRNGDVYFFEVCWTQPDGDFRPLRPTMWRTTTGRRTKPPPPNATGVSTGKDVKASSLTTGARKGRREWPRSFVDAQCVGWWLFLCRMFIYAIILCSPKFIPKRTRTHGLEQDRCSIFLLRAQS